MLGDESFQEAGSTSSFKGTERTERFGQVDMRVHGRKEGRLDGEGA